MRSTSLLVALAACGFEGKPGNVVTVDARSIDARPTDAPSPSVQCPSAPSNCTAFTCGASPASCYYYCTDTRSFGSADGICQQIGPGGCLVTLDNVDEDQCVRMHAGPGDLLYIGYLQPSGSPEPDQAWGWKCNGPTTYGPNWSGNEPNNSGFGEGEDCAAMDTAGGWVDVGCSERFRHVCEVPGTTAVPDPARSR